MIRSSPKHTLDFVFLLETMRVASEDDGFSPSWNFVRLSPSLHLLAALETPSLQLIKRLAGIKSDGGNMPQCCRASASHSETLWGRSQGGMARRVIAFVKEVKCFSPPFFAQDLNSANATNPSELCIMKRHKLWEECRLKIHGVSVYCSNAHLIGWETACIALCLQLLKK